MAIEKRLPDVPPVQLTAQATPRGVITVTDTRGFKVKQLVTLSDSSLPSIDLEVKRVASRTQLSVGPKSSNMSDRADVSVYGTTSFLYASEQNRPSVPADQINQAVYEQEPTVALRTMSVDPYGQPITTDNPLPVQLSDGSINIETLNAELRVQLSARDNDPKAGDIHSSVRLGDGHNEVVVNGDGSLNVNVIQSSTLFVAGNRFLFSEVAAVNSGSETVIISTTSPPEGLRVNRIDASGENLAKYTLYVDGQPILVKRSWWSEFNVEFVFEDFKNGLFVPSGKVLQVTALHTRPSVAPFEATISYK